MSGHSKWHQIKFKKGITDKKKGQAFSKISRMVQIAARGGADPSSNFKLRLAIDKAREINMPKDNIDRAIQKGSGGVASEQLEEFNLEGYGPAGTALFIEIVADNRNRAIATLTFSSSFFSC